MTAAFKIETLRPVRPLETHIKHLPFAYRLAIEWIDAQGDNRNATRLAGAIEHYEHATGTHDLTELDRDHYRESAEGICSRRFWNWNAQ